MSKKCLHETLCKRRYLHALFGKCWAWQRLVLTWPTFYLEHNLFWNVNMSYAIRHSLLFLWLLCTRYVLVARKKICCLCHPLRYHHHHHHRQFFRRAFSAISLRARFCCTVLLSLQNLACSSAMCSSICDPSFSVRIIISTLPRWLVKAIVL